MKIKSIYIGGWFQRTTLQLSEVYDFLREGTSQIGLDAAELQTLHDNLQIESIEYGVANEEFVIFTTADKLRVKLYEDGLIMIHSDDVNEDTMMSEAERLRNYYETCLSPAINYLFSTGAPVFKELSKVENIYPYFVICDNVPPEKLSELLVKTERQKYFEFDNKNYTVLRGDKFYFINNKKTNPANLERYVEEQIFIREFKGQLHRYLNLHRAIWGKIDRIKRQAEFTHDELLQNEADLERYAKTTMLICGRLEQMATYVQVRADAARDDKDLVEFLTLSGYRYPALRGTLTYMQSLWQTTGAYIKSGQKFLLRVANERLLAQLKTIAVLLGALVLISVLGLIFGTALKFSIDTIIYIAILVIAGVVGVQLCRSLMNKKQVSMISKEREQDEA